jgi:ParB family chromosome partitioning protein
MPTMQRRSKPRSVARLDPDEVTRWETFTRLVKEGRSPEEIALTFGLTELPVS